MTKQFCDVCRKEIYGNNKFPVNINHSKPQEYDVCGTCQTEFEKQRREADIATFERLKK
ncbi:MAG: hypothetical protein K0R34_2130 [Herbinix sp.]|jgi:hypothetical protein|nr:hypothetical protein [Herbinix sp.]